MGDFEFGDGGSRRPSQNRRKPQTHAEKPRRPSIGETPPSPPGSKWIFLPAALVGLGIGAAVWQLARPPAPWDSLFSPMAWPAYAIAFGVMVVATQQSRVWSLVATDPDFAEGGGPAWLQSATRKCASVERVVDSAERLRLADAEAAVYEAHLLKAARRTASGLTFLALLAATVGVAAGASRLRTEGARMPWIEVFAPMSAAWCLAAVGVVLARSVEHRAETATAAWRGAVVAAVQGMRRSDRESDRPAAAIDRNDELPDDLESWSETLADRKSERPSRDSRRKPSVDEVAEQTRKNAMNDEFDTMFSGEY